MPLSEDEQRILSDIERNFYEHDPAFARSVDRSGSKRIAARNCRLGAAAFVLGLAVLLGTFVWAPIVAFLGFLLMMAGGGFFAVNLRRLTAFDSSQPNEEDRRASRASNLDAIRSKFVTKFRRPE